MLQTDPVTPDRSLVLRIADGDARAVRELEQRHGTTLYAIAYWSLQDPDAADTVVQSVFAAAVENAAHGLEEPDNIFAWLVRMVRSRIAVSLATPLWPVPATRSTNHPGMERRTHRDHRRFPA